MNDKRRERQILTYKQTNNSINQKTNKQTYITVLPFPCLTHTEKVSKENRYITNQLTNKHHITFPSLPECIFEL